MNPQFRDYILQRLCLFLRFFACEEDLSRERPEAPLPDAVAAAAKALLIKGANAGG